MLEILKLYLACLVQSFLFERGLTFIPWVLIISLAGRVLPCVKSLFAYVLSHFGIDLR